MNTANIDKAIAVMERAKNLNMENWQTSPAPDVRRIAGTIDKLHRCGNSACFAGYIAISPEFKADGGRADYTTGYPIYTRTDSSPADGVAKWLGVDSAITIDFIYGNPQFNHTTQETFSVFYDKPWKEVTPQDVIAKLVQLKEIGEKRFIAEVCGIC